MREGERAQIRRASPARVLDGPTPTTAVGGRYLVEGPLGEGGVASVSCVLDVISGRRVALKRLLARHRGKHTALFEREYRTLAGLKHPHIVEVHDYGHDDDGPYYTMELLEGRDVSGLGPLPWHEVCQILRDVASGLALIHARRLLHRDLSARNVWQLPNGQVKLIDFGALAPFGTTSEVVGTPPFVAPEALRTRSVDQRTDLYALGALGYLLLTGTHAYRAYDVGELKEAWERLPERASERLHYLQPENEPAIPVALDALIAALLSLDPMARPNSAAEVIDRVCAIAELPTEHVQAQVVEAYLASKAFVGREAERTTFKKQLTLCSEGHGSSVMIEASARQGRTRLLDELTLEARLGAVVVLPLKGQACTDFHALAHALGLELLDALGRDALHVAAELLPMLGHVSHAVRDRLGLAPSQLAALPQTPTEGSQRIQNAVRDWLHAASRVRPLLLVIDDVDLLDERSLGWLVGLADHAERSRLLLLLSHTERSEQPPRALRELRVLATRFKLAPLTADESVELLRSVFGDAPNLSALAWQLHQRADGSPGQVMDLAEHLVREGVVRYVEGAWVLPATVSDVVAPLAAREMYKARLARLDDKARSLGRLLSLHDGDLSLELCRSLSDLDAEALYAAVAALVAESVLVGWNHGYRFARVELRDALREELPEDQKARAHATIGRLVLEAPDLTVTDRLHAGVHLLRGGEHEWGSQVVSLAARRASEIALDGPEFGDVAAAVRALESALELYRAVGRSDAELVVLLAPLVMAGFYGNRRSAARHGDEAVERLERVLMLPLASRLRPYFGATLSLLVALGCAALRLSVRARNVRVPSFVDALGMLIKSVAALISIAGICLDRASAIRYARALAPLSGLGKNHVATVMYELFRSVETLTEDHYCVALKRWRSLLARLESPVPIRDMPDEARAANLASCYYVVAALEALGENPQALEHAERVEKLGFKLFDLCAEQVRAVYHAVGGDLERYEECRRRVHMLAIERGSAWQAEVWSACTMSYIHLRTRDAMRMKQDLRTLERLGEEIPSLAGFERRARGVYCLLRGDPRGAIRHLSFLAAELPTAFWSRDMTALARAHNVLGEHAKAKELCLHTLAQMFHEDSAFPIIVSTTIELALADAGLDNHALAAERLDRLLETHAALGALTLGGIHEARAHVAWLAKDFEVFERHAEQMDKRYRALNINSLLEACDRFASMRGTGGQAFTASGHPRSSPPHLFAERIRRGHAPNATGLATWILDVLLEYTSLDEGYLCLVHDDGTTVLHARLGSAAPEALSSWVCLRTQTLCTNQDRDETTDITEHGTIPSPNLYDHEEKQYRLHPLEASGRIVGSVLLPASMDRPLHELLRSAARRLTTTASTASATGTLVSSDSQP